MVYTKKAPPAPAALLTPTAQRASPPARLSYALPAYFSRLHTALPPGARSSRLAHPTHSPIERSTGAAPFASARIPTTRTEPPPAGGACRPMTMSITDLETKTLTELRDIARDLDLSGYSALKKHDLIFRLLQADSERQGFLFGG